MRIHNHSTLFLTIFSYHFNFIYKQTNWREAPPSTQPQSLLIYVWCIKFNKCETKRRQMRWRELREVKKFNSIYKHNIKLRAGGNINGWRGLKSKCWGLGVFSSSSSTPPHRNWYLISFNWILIIFSSHHRKHWRCKLRVDRRCMCVGKHIQ